MHLHCLQQLLLALCQRTQALTNISLPALPISSSPQPFSIQYDGEDAPKPYLYKDGKATATFSNTDTYTGLYTNKTKHTSTQPNTPPSTYTFNSISPTTAYTGHYTNNQRHGHGTLSYPDGSTYAGQWAAGLRDGYGRYTYANGDVWVGAWRGGKRDGEGVYVWRRDGSQFSGEWKGGECVDGVWSHYAGKERRAEVKNGLVTRYL